MIDTHCHLLKEYYNNIDEVVAKMEDNKMIISGVDTISNKEVIELCSKYVNVFGTLGIHPEEIDKIDSSSLKFIEENINNPKIVAIGEIGLDYYWNSENKELQKDIFIKQIELARKYNKAIVVHSRDAIQDTYDILNEYANGLKIDIHCFGSSYDMALKFINIGCMLGVGGVITFKNNRKLVEVIEKIDLKYLLLETDSPYLTPEPFRGKTNEPYNIIYIAKKIAEIKGITLDEVLKQTTLNAISQFDLIV